MSLEDRIKQKIRDVPDYPKTGVIFKDISPLLADPQLVSEIIDAQVSHWQGRGIAAVAAVEARGFIFGSLLAHALRCSFVPVRKAGKLPYKTVSHDYSLEYGAATVEMHVDAVRPGQLVLIHDDLLATGGTAVAAGELVEKLGGVVEGFSFLINLDFLHGSRVIRKRFNKDPFYLVGY